LQKSSDIEDKTLLPGDIINISSMLGIMDVLQEGITFSSLD
jgi:hypothetical protein